MALRPITVILVASLGCMVGAAIAQSPPPGHPRPPNGPPPDGMPPPPPHGDHPPPPPPPPPPPQSGPPPPHDGPSEPPLALHAADLQGEPGDAITPASKAPAQAPAMTPPQTATAAPGHASQPAAVYGTSPPRHAIDAAPKPSTQTPASPSPWLMVSLVAVFALMMFGWWRARRHGHRLAERARKLDRDQRLLKSAHQTLKAHSERLQEQSTLDPLTGVLNRQAFAAEFRESIAHLSRFDRPVNLIVFDLDHFKSINDRQGHLAGDAALKLVVGIVREHLVSADLFGRFGGDEFLIACADQSLAGCRDLAERIRVAVQTRAATSHPSLAGLTLSMGLAQADGDTGYMPDALFARADAALYEAKRRGRNRVVVADGSTPDLPAAATHARHLKTRIRNDGAIDAHARGMRDSCAAGMSKRDRCRIATWQSARRMQTISSLADAASQQHPRIRFARRSVSDACAEFAARPYRDENIMLSRRFSDTPPLGRIAARRRDASKRASPTHGDLQIGRVHGKHAAPPALRHTHVAFLHTPLLHCFRQFKRMETL